MWHKERGIVLGTVRHNDKSSIIHIFTEGNGHVPYVLYAATGNKGARRNTITQPLTIIEFESRIVPSDTLQHLKEPCNIMPFKDIPFNPVKSSIALLLGEFLTYSLREESENRPLFSFIANAISEFDKLENAGNFHLYFILKVIGYLGIGPNTDDYQPGCWLDMRDGTFPAIQPPHYDLIQPDHAYKTVLLMQSENAQEASKTAMTGSERAGLLNCLNDYLRMHIPGFPVLKSIEVLQTVFN